MSLSTTNRASDAEPSRLCLDLTTNRQVAVKSHWIDTRKGKLDSSLRGVVNAILESTARIRWERLDQECVARHRARTAAAKQRIATAARDHGQAIETEKEFGRELLAEAKQFREAQVIRKYAHARHRLLSQVGLERTPDSEEEKWFQRATRYADSIDPLIQQSPSAAQMTPAPNVLVDALDITSQLRLRLAELGVHDSNAMYLLQRTQLEAYEEKLWAEIRQVLELG